MLWVTTEVSVMRILKRQFASMVAMGFVAAGMSQSAFAQSQPAEPSAPAAPAADPEEMCDPPGDCPPQAQATPAPEPMPEPAPAPQPQAYEPAPAPAPTYVEETETWIEGVGLGFSVGGGVDDFASDAMRDFTSLGGGWNVRATLGTRSYIAFEGSYIGSAQEIEALGLDTDAYLVGNGLQGALRVNFLDDFVVQPFVFGGIAWRHYDITNADINTSDIEDNDDVAEFPLGVGISGYIGGFMADLRGEYRWSTSEDLAPDIDDGGFATMDRWGVTGSLGFAY
jgi:hypothetical protein